MKATLEFNLPEELEEFDLATKAGELHSALFDVGNLLRDEAKNPQPRESAAKLLARVTKHFWEIVNDDHNLGL